MKTNNKYPGPHDLVRHSLSRLELVHSNSEGSRELPSHNLLSEIFKNKTCWEICNILRISGNRQTTDRQTTNRRIQNREEENAETK